MKFQAGNDYGRRTRFKNGNGAAVKYDEKYCDDIVEFFNGYEKYPTFERFAEKINVVAETLANWAAKHPRFKCAYDRAKNIQKARLIEGGLEGIYNARVVKLVALNDHGYKEKVEADTTVDFRVNMADALIEEAD